MDVLHVPLTAAAALLVLSGPGKVRRPDGTARALRQTGLPAPRAAVRALGVVETVVGVGVIVAGDRWILPAGLAALYAGFAMFVLLAVWRRAPLTSCGCFGAAGVSPTPVHAGVDAGLATIGVLAAVDPLPAPLDVLRDGGSDAAVLVVGAAALTGAIYWLFTRWNGSR
jgi:uncharacterized membrane protein YphA (DoxX/SURF4 family)